MQNPVHFKLALGANGHRELTSCYAIVKTMDKHTCSTCKKVFTRRENLIRHEKTACSIIPFVCSVCSRTFYKEANYKHHTTTAHVLLHTCSVCGKGFNRLNNMQRHEEKCHQTSSISGTGIKRPLTTQNDTIILNKKAKPSFTINVVKQALQGSATKLKISYPEVEEADILTTLYTSIHAMKSTIRQYQQKEKAVKFQIVLQAVFVKAVDPAVTTDPPVVLTSEMFEVYADTDISERMEKVYKQILNYIDVYERNGSGWILGSLQSLETLVWSLDPLRASAHHKLPAWIVSKRAVTSVKSPGYECFKWAFLAGMHSAQNDPSRVSKYQQFEELYDFNTLTYPVPLKDIDRFCKLNDCTINVYGADSEHGTVYPLKVTQNAPSTRHVNLLLTEKDGTYHYSAIKNFSRLVRSQITQYHRKHFFCYACLHGFTREDLLTKHVKYCKVENAQRQEMPVNDPVLQFTNVQKQLKAPFAVYADFECILQQHQQDDGSSVDTRTYIKEESRNSNTQAFQEHIPCSFAFKVTSIDPDYNPEIVVYKGEDAADQFIETLQAQASDIYNHYIKNPKPMTPLTDSEEEQFKQDESCHICSKPLGVDRVRDHCHILGLYRGAAHNACNVNYRIDPKKMEAPCYPS